MVESSEKFFRTSFSNVFLFLRKIKVLGQDEVADFIGHTKKFTYYIEVKECNTKNFVTSRLKQFYLMGLVSKCVGIKCFWFIRWFDGFRYRLYWIENKKLLGFVKKIKKNSFTINELEENFKSLTKDKIERCII